VKSSQFAWSAVVAVVFGLCLGCAETGGHPVDKSLVLHATGTAFLEEAGPEKGVPAADWDSTVEASGFGLPAANATTPAFKRLTAMQAAKYTAMASLVEKLRGIRVTQDSKVHDLTFAGQELGAQLAGDLSGVRVVRCEYNEEQGMAEAVVMVGLDAKGNIVPERLLPMAPLSGGARRARAEAAARINALAKLREQIGEVYVWQEIKVKNLQLSHQNAGEVVEGMLEGVEYGKAQWPSDKQCCVEATLKLRPADVERLRAMVGPVR